MLDKWLTFSIRSSDAVGSLESDTGQCETAGSDKIVLLTNITLAEMNEPEM